MRSGQLVMSRDQYIREFLARPYIEVKRDGRVLNTKTGKYLKGSVTSGGYRVFSYRKGDKIWKLSAHRVIYLAINGYLSNDLIVNHIDGDTLNNHPDNLELVTQSTNMKHKYKLLSLGVA